MGLTEKEITELRDEVTEGARPLYFFDDDADGLSSFLLLYRMTREGTGIILKTYPKLDEKFLPKVEEHFPDKIFILDIPEVTEDFIRSAHTKIIWLDHHQPAKHSGARYFNPMAQDGTDNRPTSYWAYKVSQNDMWISMAGCIGDWFLPDFADEFRAKYPDLLPAGIKAPDDALFETEIGKLSRALGFIVKGTTKECMTCVKILTRIKSPYEILKQETSQGKYIYKKYEKILALYEELKKQVKSADGKILLFRTTGDRMSFTSDLSNELLHLNPDKFIIVGREKSGEMKLSLRSMHIKVLPIVEKALIGVSGYGGGHDYACGACVKTQDFDKFVENIKALLPR